MVLDISRVTPFFFALLVKTLELGEDLFDWFAHNVGKRAQASAMRHSDDDHFTAVVDKCVNALLDAWNEALCAFKTKSLLRVELRAKEVSKTRAPKKAV